MTVIDERSTAILEATAPARWLLELAAAGGVPLTEKFALARSVVREAAERWPGWWAAEVHGPPHREADVRVLEALHDGLRRLRLVRRRGRRLFTTTRGRELAADPAQLLNALAGDLGAGEPFGDSLVHTVIGRLQTVQAADFGALETAAYMRIAREGWADSGGRPPSAWDVGFAVGDVLCRSEAYGMVIPHSDAAELAWTRVRYALSPAARALLGERCAPAVSTASTADALVFDAHLVTVPGVRARVAVRADQHLTALHDALQEAFDWLDDHLYSFWLDGRFWGDDDAEYTSPVTPDGAARTADVPIEELDLKPGAHIAYVFDFGDEWRVRLKLRARESTDGGTYPRVVQRVGQAPPQYPGLDD